jgi:putative two-component system response regulator
MEDCLVEEIISACGGKEIIVSAGDGITIPIDGKSRLEGLRPNVVLAGGRQATILVADDTEPNRVLLGELLTAEGFRVVSAEDGEVALEKLGRLKPDLVLLDVLMPGLTGFEVCRRIKHDPENCLVPVVLVTALSATEDRIRGIECGADDFLTRPVDKIQLLARVRSLLKLKARTDELERAESVLFALARSIEAKDPYTKGHCERLSDYSVRLGQCLGMSEEYLKALDRAGIVHDVGKVAVPDSVLLKKGPLTEQEWQIMREHPVIGERICAPLKSFRLVLPIIRHHHERLDGSGYPDGLHGSQIPVTAKVMQVVDVYDALTTDRPYRPALSPVEALAIMREEVQKGWWDSPIFCTFEDLIAGSGGFRAHSQAVGQ